MASSLSYSAFARIRKTIWSQLFLGIAFLGLTSSAYCDYRKGLELYRSGDVSKAVREFRKASESKRFEGYQDVIREMAKLERSPDVASNLAILRTLGIAAEKGPPETQWWMSRLWNRFGGDMPTRDPERVRWLTLAANGGYAEAAWDLWREPPMWWDGGARDVRWLKRAAELGHEEAQLALASAYIRGSEHLERNVKEAMRWARIRAAKGDAFGLASAGYLYSRLSPEERDSSEAVVWLRKAWDAGFRTWPVPHALVQLYDEKAVTDATEEEVTAWRAASRVRVIVD